MLCTNCQLLNSVGQRTHTIPVLLGYLHSAISLWRTFTVSFTLFLPVALSGLANAEEDWKAEFRRKDTLQTKTKHMQCREANGLPPSELIPKGVEVLPYSIFCDSIFELADGYIMQQGDRPSDHLLVELID